MTDDVWEVRQRARGDVLHARRSLLDRALRRPPRPHPFEALPWELLRNGKRVGVYQTLNDATRAVPGAADYEVLS
jgi:hypothetical protein